MASRVRSADAPSEAAASFGSLRTQVSIPMLACSTTGAGNSRGDVRRGTSLPGPTRTPLSLNGGRRRDAGRAAEATKSHVLADDLDLLLGFIAGHVGAITDHNHGLVGWTRLDNSALLVRAAHHEVFGGERWGRNPNDQREGKDVLH